MQFWIVPVTLALGVYGACAQVSWYYDSWSMSLAAPDGGFAVEKSIDMIAGGGAGSPSSSVKGLRDIFRAVACFLLC